jgi:cytochrome P450
MNAPVSTSHKPAAAAPLPRLSGVPLLGNALQFRDDTIGTLERGWRTLGDVYQVRLGGRVLTVFSDPATIRDALVDNAEHILRPDQINGGTLLSLALGDSVLTIDGDSWLARRRLIQPVFHRQRIHAMGDMMLAAGDRMLARWRAFEPDAPVDLAHEMKRVTLEIINQTMFGADVAADADTVGGAVDEMLTFLIGLTRMPLPLPLKIPTPANRRFLSARSMLEAYLDRIIAARRASATRRGDLLDMLLDARDEETGLGMTDRQVRNEVATIFAAGHETTALALTWTWHALNHHPAVLQALRAELDAVLGDRALTLADLPRLPYTLAVFEESLRLYPPVPMAVRKTYAPVTLDGHALPSGSLLAFALSNAHRHPRYWPNAGVFAPERFLPENKTTLRREAYLPFLTGGHMCVGASFALMEGQLLLAQMARHFDVIERPGQRIKKDVAITMRPAHGLHVRIAPRRYSGHV